MRLFGPGERVLQPQYGHGTVTKSDEYHIWIDFDDHTWSAGSVGDDRAGQTRTIETKGEPRDEPVSPSQVVSPLS